MSIFSNIVHPYSQQKTSPPKLKTVLAVVNTFVQSKGSIRHPSWPKKPLENPPQTQMKLNYLYLMLQCLQSLGLVTLSRSDTVPTISIPLY